jgi:toxin ParE1/3/4
MSKVTKRTQAERDLEESFVFIGERDLDSAFDFLAAAEQTFEFLSKMPLIGSPRAFSSARLSNVRQWPIKGYELYLIFYRPTDDGIEVLRVLHGRRDIRAVLEGE